MSKKEQKLKDFGQENNYKFLIENFQNIQMKEKIFDSISKPNILPFDNHLKKNKKVMILLIVKNQIFGITFNESTLLKTSSNEISQYKIDNLNVKPMDLNGKYQQYQYDNKMIFKIYKQSPKELFSIESNGILHISINSENLCYWLENSTSK